MNTVQTLTSSTDHGGLISTWAMIPPLPTSEDIRVEELWRDCDLLERISIGGPGFTRLAFKPNVREMYERHKRAGYVRYFGTYILMAVDYAERVSADDYEPSDKKQLNVFKNWFRRGDAILFRQVGPWKYDEYRDEYYPLQSPLVKMNPSK